MGAKVYNAQNKALHKAFALFGMPYEENKGHWVLFLCRLAKRKVDGLSELTLVERWRLLKTFQKQGLAIYNPGVPRPLWHWKKGDPAMVAAEPLSPGIGVRPLRVPKEKVAMVKKIGAILAAQKKPWAYADGIAKKRFNVQVVEWLTIGDLEKVMKMLIIHNRRHGGE